MTKFSWELWSWRCRRFRWWRTKRKWGTSCYDKWFPVGKNFISRFHNSDNSQSSTEDTSDTEGDEQFLEYNASDTEYISESLSKCQTRQQQKLDSQKETVAASEGKIADVITINTPQVLERKRICSYIVWQRCILFYVLCCLLRDSRARKPTVEMDSKLSSC
jgi:hypothetical protein